MCAVTERKHTAIRLSESALVEVDKVAVELDEARSVALRRLLALGLAAWSAGHRTAQTIEKVKP